MSQQLKVILSTLKMALATFCSRILGLVREQVLAFYFGASGLTDAFLVAYRIPNLLRDLFAEGAFSAAFVPVFVEAKKVSAEHARKLLWKLFCLLGMITLIIGGGIFIFAPEIISVFAPTFVSDPEKFNLTVLLTRIMSPFLCFVSIAALFMGALNSLKIFFLPSFAPAFFNITMILSMLLIPSFLIQRGLNPILSVGLGVFFGGLVQAFIQLPMIIKKGFGPTAPGNLISKETKKVTRLLGPGLVGFAATQINLLVNTILASSTVVGAVSWLSYAFRLFQLPVGILSVSIGNSNLVHFSEAWKNDKKDEAKKYIEISYFMSMFLVLPAMSALIFLNEEIVNIIFQRGEFSKTSTFETAKVLKWYAMGLPFYSIYKIFVPSFYAIDRQKIPVISSVGSVIFNIIFCVSMVPYYGYEILAVGTSLSILFNAIFLGIMLKKDIELEWSAFFNLRLLKLLLSFGLSAVIIYFLKKQFVFFEQELMKRLILLSTYLFTIAVSYFSFVFIFGERELVMKAIRRFKRK